MEFSNFQLTEIEQNLLNQHWKGIYSWSRLVLTLATGSLTLSIALQNYYLPQNPVYLWLLLLSWVFFIVSIFVGLLYLYSEVQLPLEAANALIQKRQESDNKQQYQEISSLNLCKVRPIYKISFYVMIVTYLLGTILFASFAGCNLS